MGELTRWSVKVSKETDLSVRSYLDEHGGKKGALSKFIERAASKELPRATVQELRNRYAHLSGEALQAIIDKECDAGRKEF